MRKHGRLQTWVQDLVAVLPRAACRRHAPALGTQSRSAAWGCPFPAPLWSGQGGSATQYGTAGLTLQAELRCRRFATPLQRRHFTMPVLRRARWFVFITTGQDSPCAVGPESPCVTLPRAPNSSSDPGAFYSSWSRRAQGTFSTTAHPPGRGTSLSLAVLPDLLNFLSPL